MGQVPLAAHLDLGGGRICLFALSAVRSAYYLPLPLVISVSMAAAPAKMQQRFSLGKAVVRLSSMALPMAEKVVAAAETAVR